MAAETEPLTLIQSDAEETKKEEKDEASINITKQPKCYCGKSMMKDKGIATKCFGCNFNWNEEEYYYYCPNFGEHTIFSCIQCAKHINTNPLKYDSCNVKKLYFIYVDSNIYGPLTIEEIMKMYIMRKFKSNRLYITPVIHMNMSAVSPATEQIEWTKIEIPQIYSNTRYERNDKRRCNLYKEYENINSEVKQKYPDLYENLVENVFYNKLQEIVKFPTDIPKLERTSLFKRFIQILGKILEIAMLIIVSIHCLPTFVVFGCCVCCVALHASQNEEKYSDAQSAAYVGFVILVIYSGMIILPILFVYLILSQTEIYEIQSWMIAYIVWGIFAFVISFVFCVGNVYQRKPESESKGDKIMLTMGSILLTIIGVEFDSGGEFQWGVDKLTFAIYPPLASFLPAAIGGFIANYILEEKFALNCSEDITNNDLCYQDGRGCCEIISSRDIESSYAFIGGLASNIIATWAILRVCGYLLVNAHSNISLYAKRKTY